MYDLVVLTIETCHSQSIWTPIRTQKHQRSSELGDWVTSQGFVQGLLWDFPEFLTELKTPLITWPQRLLLSCFRHCLWLQGGWAFSRCWISSRCWEWCQLQLEFQSLWQHVFLSIFAYPIAFLLTTCFATSHKVFVNLLSWVWNKEYCKWR